MSNADYQIFEDIIQEMMMVYRHDNRPWLIGYSGGKDSTLLVRWFFELYLEFQRMRGIKKSM